MLDIILLATLVILSFCSLNKANSLEEKSLVAYLRTRERNSLISFFVILGFEFVFIIIISTWLRFPQKNKGIYCIIIFVVAEMKQHESLTILPSPTISRSGRCFTSLLNVHPNLSPFGFMRCGCFAEYLAFLFSIILPIPP
nr:MAG TPA: hypothetical protein [Caudoviricetes sp.]